MTYNTQPTWIKNASIPVNAVLAFRTHTMHAFDPCPVLNISTNALDILLDQPLPDHTRVTLAVHPEGAGQRPYFVSGEVKQCGLQDAGWQHQIVASSDRPWSPMFLYDVMCSVDEEPAHPDQAVYTQEATAQPSLNRLAA